MSRHAAGWTMGRRLADRFGAMRAGKHNPIWDLDIDPWAFTTEPKECKYCREIHLDHERCLNEWTVTPGGGLINQTAFDYMAHDMFGDRK